MGGDGKIWKSSHILIGLGTSTALQFLLWRESKARSKGGSVVYRLVSQFSSVSKGQSNKVNQVSQSHSSKLKGTR